MTLDAVFGQKRSDLRFETRSVIQPGQVRLARAVRSDQEVVVNLLRGQIAAVDRDQIKRAEPRTIARELVGQAEPHRTVPVGRIAADRSLSHFFAVNEQPGLAGDVPCVDNVRLCRGHRSRLRLQRRDAVG